MILTGKTGLGKAWLACAIAQRACRGVTIAGLCIAPADCSYAKAINGLAKPATMILDDIEFASLGDMQRRDLWKR